MNLPIDLDQKIAKSLEEGLPPGRAALEKFAPALCYGRHFGYAPCDVRPAAVIMALYQKQGDWFLPLTRRPTNMKDHAGQICLPGGGVEKGESPADASLRELEEELGIPATDVELLGNMPGLNLYVSNFWVTPFVAVLPAEPKFVANPDEVADVIESPLAALIDPANHRLKQRRVGGSGEPGWSYRVPYIAVGDKRIWGATAVILGGLIEIVDSILSKSE